LAVAQCYVERLKRLDSHVRIQSSVLAFHHARHLFSVQLPLEEIRHSRDEVLKALRLRNVGAGVHYAPLHRMPLYGRQSALPNTERVCERILTLPISASMSVVDADYVMSHFCDLIR
jgi:dTDP-4-amino-4,6-dideoxygalactose transaminase